LRAVPGPAIGVGPRIAFRGREADSSVLIEAAAQDAQRSGLAGGLSYVQWVTAVLCNSLGRYEQALATAQPACEGSPAQQFSIWGLVELIEAAARSRAPKRAASAPARHTIVGRTTALIRGQTAHGGGSPGLAAYQDAIHPRPRLSTLADARRRAANIAWMSYLRHPYMVAPAV